MGRFLVLREVGWWERWVGGSPPSYLQDEGKRMGSLSAGLHLGFGFLVPRKVLLGSVLREVGWWEVRVGGSPPLYLQDPNP